MISDPEFFRDFGFQLEIEPVEPDFFIEATAERDPFTRQQMDELLELARKGIEQLVKAQREAIQEVSG